MAFGYVAAAVTIISAFVILFTRRYPRGLFNLVVGYNRWTANVYAYLMLARDEYPPFSMDAGRYPVTYEVDYPERLNRWLIFVKWLLVLPHQFVLYLLTLIAMLFYTFAWFGILITGRYPRTFFNFNVGVMRWYLRVGAYASLLRDEFPPYSKRADAGPASRPAVVISVLFACVSFVGLVGGVIALQALDPGTRTVGVEYRALMSGSPSLAAGVDGALVTLTWVEDPYIAPDAEPTGGKRFVSFDLEIWNEDSYFVSIAETAFRLDDTNGDKQWPTEVLSLTPVTSNTLGRGEDITVIVIFELDTDADPVSLTYSPGFAAFLPFGERVKFVFY